MKKNLFVTISLLLALAMPLSACTTPTTGGNDDAGTADDTNTPVTAGENWVSDTEVSLKVWSVRETTIEDIATNSYIEWLQNETNVKLDFEQVSFDGSLQKFNLSLASSTQPDIYFAAQIQDMNSTLKNSILMQYGDSVFIPLNDLIEEHGTNTKELFNDVAWVEDGITMPDGNIYALPSYSEIYHVKYSQKVWIDQTWLDNLDLEMPTTTDEYYDVLKAFKEEDANGNGDPSDEIPLAGSTDAWHGDPSDFLMNAFIYDDGDKLLMVNDDNVESIINQEAYKDGLTFINKLYDEGLLYSESYAQDSSQLKSLTAQSPNIVGGFAAGAPMGVVDAQAELYQTAVVVPPLEGPDGHQTAGFYEYGNLRDGAYMITSSCENPEAAFKLGDFMLSEISSVTLRQGVQGTDWRYAEEGETTFDDKPAEFARLTPLVTDGYQNSHWGNSGVFRETNDQFIGAWAVDDSFDIRSLAGIEQLLIEQTWPYDGYEPEQTLPPVVFTDDIAPRVSELEVEIRRFAEEQRTLFITGQRDLSEWDDYLKELDNLGLEEMVRLYNEAYQNQYVK